MYTNLDRVILKLINIDLEKLKWNFACTVSCWGCYSILEELTMAEEMEIDIDEKTEDYTETPGAQILTLESILTNTILS